MAKKPKVEATLILRVPVGMIQETMVEPDLTGESNFIVIETQNSNNESALHEKY